VKASSRQALRRLSAVTGTVALLGLATAPTFAADDTGTGGVKVVNTETVQVYLSPSGHIESKRVYEQLALTGHGSVDLKNPVSTNGLRNLDGFGGFHVVDGEQIAKTTVDGTKHYRSVSNYTGTLPVAVTPTYKLDGKTVSPGDIVGESGKLEVKFEIANKTTKPEQVSYDDGTGHKVTKTVEVPVPMVGSLTTTAPASFTNVDPGGASTAGDGTGGTTMSYNLVLFPPIGSTTTTVGYTADITDGIVPRVDVAMLPVDPLSSPTFKVATDGYQGGATTGAQLVTGADTIDANLLKLRDGASELLAGLIKLSDGAGQLHSGLADDAAPGAKKLADGTGDALDGSKKLADGAKKLDGGLGTASGGGAKLDQGAKELLAGQKALAGGLKQLYAGIDALPTAVQAQLNSSVDYLKLLGGLQGIANGVRAPGTTDCGASSPVNCGAADGLDATITQLNGALAGPASVAGTVASLVAAIGNIAATPDCGALACQPTVAGTQAAVQTALTGQLQAIVAGLTKIRNGIDHGTPGACNTPTDCGILQGALTIKAGIPVLMSTVLNQIRGQLLASIGSGAAGCDPTKTLQCGANALSEGTEQLAAGVTQLVSGLSQLDDGGAQLAAGAGDLADGLGQIDGGAKDLANGLGDAADGSGQIADGLKTAAGSAPQIPDGAQRLSTEGISQLSKAGKDTAVNYGQLYAVIAAGAQRAQTESMAFGAPKGAEGLTAYSFVIRGDDGESSRNVTRAVAAFALLGLGSGVCVLRRRMV
jgi:putative membrane protein